MRVTLFIRALRRARESYSCRVCGTAMNPVERMLNETCGRCVKRLHAQAVGRRSRETVTRRSAYRPYRKVQGSGGVRGFAKLLPRIPREAKNDVCAALVDTEDALWDALGRSVRERDLYTLDHEAEEMKWVGGALRSCRLR